MGNQIIHAEWVGKHVKIIKATNQNLVGIEGTIVDETKHLLTLETDKGLKKVPKKGAVFIIEEQEIEGARVIVAPEERIKLR